MGENPNFQNFSYYPITDKQELGTKDAWIIQDKIKATYGQLHAAIQRGDWTHMVNLSNQYTNPFHIAYAPDRLYHQHKMSRACINFTLSMHQRDYNSSKKKKLQAEIVPGTMKTHYFPPTLFQVF